MKRLFAAIMVFGLATQGLNCEAHKEESQFGAFQPDGAACSDNDACTQTDTCQAGLCGGADPIHCDVGSVCSQGTCISVTCPAEYGFPGSRIHDLGARATKLVAKDLNGDNIIDIAISEGSANQVGVMFGVGDGTFGPRTDYPAGTSPQSIEAADLNADGANDLAIANSVSNDVSILMNTGNGTFAPKMNYASGAGPTAMRIADVNGDQKLDVITTNWTTNNFSVLMNNGDGTFAPKMDYGAGCMYYPSALGVADLNGDGKPDTAVGCENEHLKLFYNDGMGGFVPGGKVLSSAESRRFTDIEAGDFNGDGKIDLTGTRDDVGALDVVQNNGDGSFTTKSIYVGRYLRSLVVVDVNSDGKPDIATTDTEGNCRVFTNTGDFTFTKTEYGAVVHDIQAADVNGDNLVDFLGLTYPGSPDIVGGLAVLLNNGNGMAAPRAIVGFPFTQPRDVTGDGLPEIITAYGSDASIGISVMIGDADGSYEDHVDYPTSSLPRDATLMDLNHDGKLDIVASLGSGGTLTKLLNLGNGKFDGPNEFLTDTNAVVLRAGDFNRDGFDDLAAINYKAERMSILLHTGQGTLVRAAEYVTNALPESIEVFDFDHDNDLDILVLHDSSPQIAGLFINNGCGTFAPRIDFPFNLDVYKRHVADVNGDGHFDIVGINQDDNSLDVLLNNGDGSFAPVTQYPTFVDPWGSAVTDLNGDQLLDIVVGGFAGNGLYVHLNQGGGVFNTQLHYPSVHFPLQITAADLNGDLKPDLIVSGPFSTCTHLNVCIP